MENMLVIVLVAAALIYIIHRMRGTLSQGEEEIKCSKCAANRIAKTPPKQFLPKS